MKNNQTSQTINAWDTLEEPQENNNVVIQELSQILAEWQNYIIEKVTDTQYIRLSEESITSAWFTKDSEIEIRGEADADVQAIEVAFSNKSSDLPDDSYMLKNYEAWASSFSYKASSLFEVLDYGENVYVFTAKTRDGDSKTQLTIKIDDESSTNPQDTDETENSENSDTENSDKSEQSDENIATSIDDVVFPKWEFWEAIVSGSSIYYSDLKGLDISKAQWLSSVVCAAPAPIVVESNESDGDTGTGETTETSTETAPHSITEFLLWKYKTWLYWNTCRPIVQWKWVSFYVIRLTGDDQYKYEKHYLDYENNLHWVQELQSWDGVTKENISAKNQELKNETFDITDISDKLFQEIINKNNS